MSYAENDYLMISGIQHFMFCRRQWALIHIEQQWQENRLTVEGEVIHRNAHKDDFIEKRPGILVTRGLRVFSPTLGITGQCDVVEFLSSEEGVPLHGHRGLWQARQDQWSTTGAKIKKMIQIFFSSVPKPCVWKKCYTAGSHTDFFTTTKYGDGERSTLMRISGAA